jgi:tetratricopeptide (TPR) repeat protein
LLGRAYLKIGDGAAAEKELIRARQSGASKELVLIPTAELYYLQRKYDLLFDRIRPGRRDNETETEILVIHGRARLALRDLDAAEQNFADAIRRRPDYAPPQLGRARVLISRGRLDQAEPFANKALEMGPTDPESWYVRGELRRLKKDFFRSDTALRQGDRH